MESWFSICIVYIGVRGGRSEENKEGEVILDRYDYDFLFEVTYHHAMTCAISCFHSVSGLSSYIINTLFEVRGVFE